MTLVTWRTNGGPCTAGPMPKPWALNLRSQLLAAGYRDVALFQADKLTTGN